MYATKIGAVSKQMGISWRKSGSRGNVGRSCKVRKKRTSIRKMGDYLLGKEIKVVAAMIEQDGNILCMQRKSGTLANKWEVPGGKVEAGETLEEALKREVKEELACEIEVGVLIADVLHPYDFGKIRLLTFHCTITKGVPKLIDHLDKKWLSRKQLLSLDWVPADLTTVRRVLSQR